MLHIAKEEDRFPRAGELASEIADVADNARSQGVTMRRRILRLRRATGFNRPEDESPKDALIWFGNEMLLVSFRLLSCAHHCVGRAIGFDNENVAEIGGIRDQLGSFILTMAARSGVDIAKNPPIAAPWEAYRPEVKRDA